MCRRSETGICGLKGKSLIPETAIIEMFSSSFQLCRYLYYLGRIRTIQLEYTDAKECLLQAARKAPSTARGFRIQCNKWAVIVRLLLGEIPERTTFMQQGMQKPLRPYFELTNVHNFGLPFTPSTDLAYVEEFFCLLSDIVLLVGRK